MKSIVNTTVQTFRILAILLAGMAIYGCEDEFDMYRHFVIRKGKHYSTPNVAESLQADRLVFDARFDETAIYDLHNDALQTNKNKLMGFADCNSLHHENSARFAWQWYNDQLEIFAYCYVNGQRHEQFVGTVEPNETHRYEIEITDTQYLFKLDNNESIPMTRGNHCNTGVYYKLWPYFGGSVPAPHEITIAIRTYY